MTDQPDVWLVDAAEGGTPRVCATLNAAQRLADDYLARCEVGGHATSGWVDVSADRDGGLLVRCISGHGWERGRAVVRQKQQRITRAAIDPVGTWLPRQPSTTGAAS